MSRIEEIHELYAYNRWANERVHQAAAGLTQEELRRSLVSSFSSVQATLVHMLAAEWIWLGRWKGVSAGGMPSGWAEMDLPALRAAWAGVADEQRSFVEGLQEGDLDRVVEYRTVAGASHAQPLGALLRHVVNHASYHRGQVATLLRQVGATPPATDLALYLTEGAAE